MEVLDITEATQNSYNEELASNGVEDGAQTPDRKCEKPLMALSPLYRMWQPTAKDHFYTVDANEYDRAAKDFGYTKEGIVGYVLSNYHAGAMPFFRLWNPSIADHFYTMSVEERDAAVKGGYTFEGVTGYIYPPMP